MRHIVFLILILFAGTGWISSAPSSDSQELILRVTSVKNPKESHTERMQIVRSENRVTVRYSDRNGQGSVNEFSPKMEALYTAYVDGKNQKYQEIRFDRDTKKIQTSGAVTKTYSLEENTYDGNGALFYVFSQIAPEPGKEIRFHLLQSKEKRIVEMSLKFAGREKIQTSLGERNCLKYETRLVSRFLAFFWPYSYYYWFDEKTGEFLRYEGPAGHDNAEVIEVIQ